MTLLGLWGGDSTSVPVGYIGRGQDNVQMIGTWEGLIGRTVHVGRSRQGSGQLNGTPEGDPNGTYGGAFIQNQDEALIADGKLASMQIQPKYGEGSGRIGVRYNAIANGNWDDFILDGMAELDAKLPAGVLTPFEIHSEANIQDPPPAAQPYSGEPDEYAAFCKKIHELAITAGIRDRMLFVLSMTRGGWTGTTWRTWMDIGGPNNLRNIIDVLAVDGYSQPSTGNKKELSFIAGPVITVARSLGKPWGVFETGCQPDPNDASYKPGWYDRARQFLVAEGDDCYAVVFNVTNDGPGSWMPEDNGGGPGTAAGNNSLDRFLALTGSTAAFDGTVPIIDDPDPPPPDSPIIPTVLTSVSTTTGGPSMTTPAFSPPVDTLILVELVANGVTAAPTVVTDGWTLIDSVSQASVGWSGVYGRIFDTDPGSVTFTATWSTDATAFQANVIKATGTDITSVEEAVPQSDTSVNASGTSLALSLGSPLQSPTESRMVAFVSHMAQEGTTPRANWDELADASLSGPASAHQAQWRGDAPEANGSASWSTTSAAAGIMLELAVPNVDPDPEPDPGTIVPTVIVDAHTTTDATGFSFVASSQPTANKVLVAFIHLAAAGDPEFVQTPIIDAWGLSWNIHEEQKTATDGVFLATAQTSAFDPLTDTFDIAFADETYNHTVAEVAVYEVDGANLPDPIATTTSDTGTAAAGTTTATPQLALSLPSGGLVLAAFGATSNVTSTPGAGMTEGTDVADTTPARAMTTVYSTTTGSPTITWPSAQTFKAVGIALQPGSAVAALVSWAEMEVTYDGGPMTSIWRMSDLGGGGGVNCIAVSPYDDSLIEGGDISGPMASIDTYPPVWTGARGGLADGGSSAVIGGLDYTANATYPQRAWMFFKDGFAVSENRGLDWEIISSAPTFGEGGGTRPRRNGGHVGMSTFVGGVERVFMVDFNGTLRRWTVSGDQSDPTAGTLATLGTAGMFGVGESVWIDPNNSNRLFVGSRTGAWIVDGVNGAVGSVTTTKFTNLSSAYELVAVDEGGTTVLYVAALNDGIRRGAVAGAGTTFANKTGSNMQLTGSLWCTISARRSGGVTRVVAGCSDPRQVQTPTQHYETYFYTDNPAATSPTWVCMSTREALINDQGDGTESWMYLPTSEGGAGNTGNPLVTRPNGSEDCRIDPRDFNRAWLSGQQGVWEYEFDTADLYPRTKRLGLTSNWQQIADPNSPGTFYNVNHDHVLWGTRDIGETYRKNEQGDMGAQYDAGFAVAVESGVSISRVWLGYGDRDANTDGGVFYHADPMSIPMTPWDKVGTIPSNRRVFGVAARRMLVSGTVRVVAIAATQAGGIVRGVFTTADPPGVVSDWAVVNATPGFDIGAGGNGYNAPMFFASDTMAYCFDPSSGLWCSRNAGATWARIWNVTDNAASEGYIAPDPAGDDGTVFVSLGPSTSGAGANDGVWKLTNCDAAGATVEAGTITKTEVRRGATSFTFAGPIAAFNDGRMWVLELPIAVGADPKCWYTDDDGSTWANIADDTFRRTARKVRAMSADPDGNLALSMAGPGVLMYLSDAVTEPPVGEEARAAVTHVYLELPDPTVTPDPPPVVDSFDPVEGEVGTLVTITGSNFTGATGVSFSGTPAVSFTVVNDTTITATVPTGANSGAITVTTPDGVDASPTSFTVNVDDTGGGGGGGGTGSTGNPQVEFTSRVIAIWLVDREFGTTNEPAKRVKIIGRDGDTPQLIGESSTVLYPVGSSRPVRITNAIRGYEGTVSGFLPTRDDLRTLENMKRRSGTRFRLVFGDLNIPVQLGEMSVGRHPTEDGLYPVSINVEQVGEFDIEDT